VSQLNSTVAAILDDIRQNGDKAVMAYEEKFDHARLQSLAVTQEEFEEARTLVDDDLYDALMLAHHNIEAFHAAQKHDPVKVETCPGVTCWQKSIAIERVGLYVPGGTAPLFSTVLMLATPARIAGCHEIVLCTPPNSEGKVHPAILVAARIAGVNKVFKAGGVQAIGAMAYGTESVPKVFKIFGPGNQYVMAAKQQVSLHDVAIDMPAGPSEVCVICDANSNAEFVAADLLSQAEHGIDSQVFLISTSEEKIQEVCAEVERQLSVLPRKEIATRSLDNSSFVLVHDTDEAIALSNVYAPEHLIIATADYASLAEKVVNAGSVFLGDYACESAGDYASGTNHTLPTHGYATAYNGVNLDSYNRKVTFQQLSQQGIESIGRAVELMAENEQLHAHKNAMTVRRNSIKK
jgi:histidinol dehydrogenase